MHPASPTSDEGFENYLDFYDTLFYELAMFACDHPALLPEEEADETTRQEEGLEWLKARIEDIKAGRAVLPRPRRQPRLTPRQVRAGRASVVMFCRTIRQLALGDVDIERLLDAFAHGLTGVIPPLRN